jgi:hypothetical protein
MSRIGDSGSFSIARAYAQYATKPAAGASEQFARSEPIKIVDAVRAPDTVEARPEGHPEGRIDRSKINRLVAAKVEVTPDIADAVARSSMPAAAAGAYAMYRHPADRNAAATALNAGRVLDVQA